MTKTIYFDKCTSEIYWAYTVSLRLCLSIFIGPSVSASAPSLGLVSRYSMLLSGPLWRVSAFISAVWGFSHTTPVSDASWLFCHDHPILTPSTQRQHQIPKVKGSILRDYPLLQMLVKSSGCHLCLWPTQRSEVQPPPEIRNILPTRSLDYQYWAPFELRSWLAQSHGAERLTTAACAPGGHTDPCAGSDSSCPEDHEPSCPHSQWLLPRFVLLWNGENVPAPPFASGLKQLSYWPASDSLRRKQRVQWKGLLGRVWRRNSFHRCC